MLQKSNRSGNIQKCETWLERPGNLNSETYNLVGNLMLGAPEGPDTLLLVIRNHFQP